MNTTIPETRQEFLDEAVSAASQVTETDIAAVLNSIVDLAKEESKKSDAYGKMFEASHKGLRGLLDEANDQMVEVVLNTMDIMEEKGLLEKGGDDYVRRNRIYYMLKLLPIMCVALEFDINAREGWSCEQDKVRQIVYEAFMKILEFKPNEPPQESTSS
ncbi:MAG: hypothetical protein ACK5DE_02880 [Bacteroidota bacterium]|jgi:sulfur transfer complex TusBCD TusB component (DsrH family)